MNYIDHGDHIELDGQYIPRDPENSDYVRYLEWVDAGNTASSPPPAPTPVPQSVTMRQARLALLEAGRLQAVGAAIAALPSPQREAAQIEWEYAANVERASPFLQGLASALSMDENELDQLFILAAGK